MNQKDIFWVGAGVMLIIGGVFIHIQLARIFDQQTKKIENPELEKRMQSRVLMIRAAEGVALLLGLVFVVIGWLGQRLNHQ